MIRATQSMKNINLVNLIIYFKSHGDSLVRMIPALSITVAKRVGAKMITSDRLSREGVSRKSIAGLHSLSAVRCSVNRFKAVRRRVVLLIGAEHRLPTTFPLRPSPAVSMHRVPSPPLNFSAIFEDLGRQ